MASIIAEDGQLVTEDMLSAWCGALDNDEWPAGWKNVGPVVDGKPPNQSETLSVKIPSAMKSAIDYRAKAEGLSTSAYIRGLIASSLMAS